MSIVRVSNDENKVIEREAIDAVAFCSSRRLNTSTISRNLHFTYFTFQTHIFM